MYSEEDLRLAIKSGIFTDDSVGKFRALISNQQNTVLVDEEHFRLVTGFNDIFVVIASVLLLISIGWLGSEVNILLGALGVAVTSWSLTEFFVAKRKMALPAIVLLLIYIASIAVLFEFLSLLLAPSHQAIATVVAGLTAATAAYLHWLRFKVPITVAIGVGAVVVAASSLLMIQFPGISKWLNAILLIAGLMSFYLAMRWDAQDTERKTRKSDVAFWLHLLAAPLIVHPVFTALGVFEGRDSIGTALVVIALYILLGMISIAIDRRALMVSALIYVLYAFSALLKNYGIVSLGFAVTGLVIGSSLLVLSAYWHKTRRHLMESIPNQLRVSLPSLKD